MSLSPKTLRQIARSNIPNVLVLLRVQDLFVFKVREDLNNFPHLQSEVVQSTLPPYSAAFLLLLRSAVKDYFYENHAPI